MRPWYQILPLVALLCAGCVTSPATQSNVGTRGEAARIQQRLEEIFDAVGKKDVARVDSYHAYGPHFTKFTTESTNRLDAVAAREGEHAGLAPVSNLVMRADDLKIDVFGNVGIATFILDYHFEYGGNPIAKRGRATLVLVKKHGSWKITHEHLSAIKTAP